MTTIPPRLEPIVRELMNQVQTGSIIAAAFNLPDRGTPRYGSSASLTSDGFLISNFTGRDGQSHMGAFVGSKADLDANISRFIDHFELTAEEVEALSGAIANWIRT